MELKEVTFKELLIARHYLIISYRSEKPISYQVERGAHIGSNEQYFSDGEDIDGNPLTWRFFLIPEETENVR